MRQGTIRIHRSRIGSAARLGKCQFFNGRRQKGRPLAGSEEDEGEVWGGSRTESTCYEKALFYLHRYILLEIRYRNNKYYHRHQSDSSCPRGPFCSLVNR